MNRKIIYVIFSLLCSTISIQAQECIIKGKVTSSGIGVKNVVVTDGVTCVLTDESGQYIIPSMKQEGFVSISTPAGYTTEVKDVTIPQFYKKIEQGITSYDFEIIKNPIDDKKHVFFVHTDVQVTEKHDLTESYQKIIDDCNLLRKQYKGIHQFGIDCGDVVGDTPALYPTYIETVKSLDIPIYRAIGNHDMDYYGRTHETSDLTFSSYFGPTHYSFNKGNAHYIVINNNFFIGRDYFYMGYIDEKTFAWLEQDLSHVEKGSLIFLIMHIPARLKDKQSPFQYSYGGIADQTVNVGSLFEMLKPYNTHIITGHMHYNLNISHAPNILEHNTASICGTWWRGEICLDGTPQGYGVYEVDGKDVKWYYKGSGYPKEHQMRVYPIGTSTEHPECIIANVWNWDKEWKVEWLENGKPMGKMEQYTGNDPEAEKLCADKEKIKYDWISVMPNEHMFKAIPKNKNAKIEVRVTDRFGKVYTQPINK